MRSALCVLDHQKTKCWLYFVGDGELAGFASGGDSEELAFYGWSASGIEW